MAAPNARSNADSTADPDERTCFRCGYPLVGLAVPRCPECGCDIVSDRDLLALARTARSAALVAFDLRAWFASGGERTGSVVARGGLVTATVLLAWLTALVGHVVAMTARTRGFETVRRQSRSARWVALVSAAIATLGAPLLLMASTMTSVVLGLAGLALALALVHLVSATAELAAGMPEACAAGAGDDVSASRS